MEEWGTPNTQRFPLTSSGVQNMRLRKGSVGSSYIHFGADLISFRFSPEILLWHHLRWSLNNSILQEEFPSTEQMNANQQEFYFQGQLVLHPTAHQSVILLDGFSESIQPWTLRHLGRAFLVDSKGAEASWISQMTRDGWYFWKGSCRGWKHLTMCSHLSPLKEDSHGNDTGTALMEWSGVRLSSPPLTRFLPLSISQSLSSQYWLRATIHARNLFSGGILTAKSRISKSGRR